MPERYTTEESSAAVSLSLYEDGVTDGLPVIPPTDERVEEMLRGTDRPREEILGRLGNNDNPLTVEGLAANAVMAGCLPTYMPVLEAGARALADPDSNSIQFSVSTGGWAYQWLVNGPVREALDIAGETGAFGPNYHANQTIARALGIAYKNTARIHPGEKDMGVMGNPFKFSLLAAENQEQSPWEPYHVTHGFDDTDSTITLAGPNCFLQWAPDGERPEDVLAGMIDNTPPLMVGGTQQGGDFDQTVLYVLSPETAATLADAGLAKRAVTEYLVENAYIPREAYQRGVIWDGALERYDGEVERRMVPQFEAPEYVKVATAGGGGRYSAVIGPSIGGPVTKRIEFPDGWDRLLAEYDRPREWGPGRSPTA